MHHTNLLGIAVRSPDPALNLWAIPALEVEWLAFGQRVLASQVVIEERQLFGALHSRSIGGDGNRVQVSGSTPRVHQQHNKVGAKEWGHYQLSVPITIGQNIYGLWCAIRLRMGTVVKLTVWLATLIKNKAWFPSSSASAYNEESSTLQAMAAIELITAKSWRNRAYY